MADDDTDTQTAEPYPGTFVSLPFTEEHDPYGVANLVATALRGGGGRHTEGDGRILYVVHGGRAHQWDDTNWPIASFESGATGLRKYPRYHAFRATSAAGKRQTRKVRAHLDHAFEKLRKRGLVTHYRVVRAVPEA